MDKPDKCRWCGRVDTEVMPHRLGSQVFCSGCLALGPIKDTPEQAAEAWNSRPGEGVQVKPLMFTEEERKEWWLAECPECQWRGLSRDCAGGDAIADTGDFNDVVCPVCIKADKWVVVEDWEPKHWIPVQDEQHLTPSEPVNAELVRALEELIRSGLAGEDDYRLVLMACKGFALSVEENAVAERFGAARRAAIQALARANSQDGQKAAQAEADLAAKERECERLRVALHGLLNADPREPMKAVWAAKEALAGMTLTPNPSPND